MATEGGRIDFMLLGPPPYPAAGSATAATATQRGLGVIMISLFAFIKSSFWILLLFYGPKTNLVDHQSLHICCTETRTETDLE